MADQEKVGIKITEPTVIQGIGHVGRGFRKVSPQVARELFAAGRAIPQDDKDTEITTRDDDDNGTGDGETGDE